MLFFLLFVNTILCAECAFWTHGKNAVLSVDLTNINSYSISIENETWLHGGEPNLWCNQHWYSTRNYDNIHLLQPQSSLPIETNGTDENLGVYFLLKMTYKLISSDNICNGKIMTISFQYFDVDDFFLFTQTFPHNLANTNIKQYTNPPSNPMIPLSEFPAFSFSESSMLRTKLSYIEWRGRFMHDQSTHGIGLNHFGGGNEGGPIVLFKDDTKPTSALVFSTATNFMNGIFAIRTRRGATDTNCTLINNTDMNSNDIELIQNIESVEDCCSLCIINEYCNVFSYIPNQSGYSKNCYLKYNDHGKENYDGHISGYIGNDIENLDYLVAGIQGNLTFIPANYSISFIISAVENQGIHGAMYKWGRILQRKYKTKKLDPSVDLTVSTLGYWTDNGGYYYGGNPLTTDIAIQLFNAFKMNNIPVRYLQLDPYWYMNTSSNPPKNAIWVPRSDLFPNGLTDLYNKIGQIPLLLYSSYWAANTTENYYNSKYNLSLEFANSMDFDVGWFKGPIAEPIGYESSYKFYKFILDQYADIMMGFEVDFMDFEYEQFSELVNGYNGMVNMSEQWTKGMQDACFENNLSVQYCMSLPCYILQSLQYPSVTNARASEDDNPPNHNRWQIAYTSLLLSPLSIRPFFDVFWTTSIQPGNKYNVNTMDCEMDAIIATLSTGPVGIGDDINMTNKTIIHRIVRSDGIILKPSWAITPIDSMYYNNGYKPSNGEIWMTYSNIKTINNPFVNTISSYIVLAVDVDNGYILGYEDLFPFPVMWEDSFVVYKFNQYLKCRNNTDPFNDKSDTCTLVRFDGGGSLLTIETDAAPINNPTHLHSWNLYN
eukprot:184028_1